jgi:tRNA/tmRNA/rRNA uracil-C5-methylase (TrmA/RlmC/RlmD family)
MLDSSSFWQVHTHAAEVLWDAVGDAVLWDQFDQQANNLDLYGGVGLFAAALASRGGENTRVVSVESHPGAGGFAESNLRDFPQARALTLDARRFVEQEVAGADPSQGERYRHATVVVDPPRQGLGTEMVHSVLALAPKQIVYVACDPVALARDTKALREGGYELHHLAAFDLFPHTGHIETVVLMTQPGLN